MAFVSVQILSLRQSCVAQAGLELLFLLPRAGTTSLPPHGAELVLESRAFWMPARGESETELYCPHFFFCLIPFLLKSNRVSGQFCFVSVVDNSEEMGWVRGKGLLLNLWQYFPLYTVFKVTPSWDFLGKCQLCLGF